MQCMLTVLDHETFDDDFTTDVLQGAFGRIAGMFIFLAVSLQVRQRL